MTRIIKWGNSHPGGYEVSTKGDSRFSALCAQMPDGRTIEQWYQCDVKGWQPGGHEWRLGKGREPLVVYRGDGLWQAYLALWRMWAIRHAGMVVDLAARLPGYHDTLTDQFARHEVNQARALATIINDWVLGVEST